MYLKQYFLEGLGCLSYLVGDEETGDAAVIDPQVTVDEYRRDADAAGLRIRHVLDTHLHADHLSGARALAKATGATLHLPATANAGYPHERFEDGAELRLGNVVVRGRATPGHTPEHLTYELMDHAKGTERPYAILSGDTLLVGSVGRPDLVGTTGARELAGMMFDTVRNVLCALPDGTLVYPGHGPGSACGSRMSQLLASSMGYEKETNGYLEHADRQPFVHHVTTDLPPKPGNAVNLKRLNTEGPPEFPPDPGAVPALDPDAFGAAAEDRGVVVLDVREPDAFAANFVPGSVNVPLSPAQFPNRVAHYLEWNKRVLLVVPDEAGALGRAVVGLARVGGVHVAGVLAGGIEAWRNAGKPFDGVASYSQDELREAVKAGSARVLDVRSHDEWTSGHVEGATWIPWEELEERMGDLDPAACWVAVCGSGYRSIMAASVLRRSGFRGVGNLLGGMTAWNAAGQPVVTGERRANPPVGGSTGDW